MKIQLNDRNIQLLEEFKCEVENTSLSVVRRKSKDNIDRVIKERIREVYPENVEELFDEYMLFKLPYYRDTLMQSLSITISMLNDYFYNYLNTNWDVSSYVVGVSPEAAYGQINMMRELLKFTGGYYVYIEKQTFVLDYEEFNKVLRDIIIENLEDLRNG